MTAVEMGVPRNHLAPGAQRGAFVVVESSSSSPQGGEGIPLAPIGLQERGPDRPEATMVVSQVIGQFSRGLRRCDALLQREWRKESGTG